MFEFLKRFTNTTLRHILYNYAQDEVGLHHPRLPVGVCFRDQGQADLYSGQARIILTTDGDIAHLGKTIGLVAENVVLAPKDITNLRVLGKHFDEATFAQKRKITALKAAGVLEKFRVIDPAVTFVDPNTLKIVNDVPLTEILESFDLFVRDPVDDELPSPEQEITSLILRSLNARS